MMDILEAARLLRFQSPWERRFHAYCLLTDAGIEPEESERIVSLAEADREAADHIEFVMRAA